MDFRATVWAAAIAAVAASFLTIVAVHWWPAWFVLAAVWAVALLVLLRPRPEQDEDSSEVSR